MNDMMANGLRSGESRKLDQNPTVEQWPAELGMSASEARMTQEIGRLHMENSVLLAQNAQLTRDLARATEQATLLLAQRDANMAEIGSLRAQVCELSKVADEINEAAFIG